LFEDYPIDVQPEYQKDKRTLIMPINLLELDVRKV
jgi:hypothetical protein